MSKQADRRKPRTAARRHGERAAPPTVQYTVRGVPAHVDKALRRKARERRQSLNEALRDALVKEAAGIDAPAQLYSDLDALAGSWIDVPGFDSALRAQDRIDETLWR